MSKDKISFIPSTIEELIGYNLLFPDNCLIKKMLENNKIFSCLFFGDPGTGKSLSIKLFLKKLNRDYYYFNSSSDKKSDLDEILRKTKDGEKPIIVIEEIHRLNKDKQDLLLMYLEKNLINIFATTTENPFFVVNPAIRSRLLLYNLKKLTFNELKDSLKNFLKSRKINLSNRIIEIIVSISNCDFRQIFTIIEIVLTLYKDNSEDEIEKELLRFSNSNIDRSGSNFYNTLSAFHKSIRGSNPDAAIYYLAILLKDNNLQPIFRRLTAVAYEDIGLANPSIWPKVNSAIEAAKLLGMPEAKLPLAAITIDLALSPKSNSSACAIWDAEEEISKSYYDIPNHIKDSSYSSASKLNVKNYKYPHNFEFNYVEQQYLPNEIKNKKFYKYNKYSANENKYINYWKKVKYEKK